MSAPDLPEHVRKLVAEIEREIGEDDDALNGRERNGEEAEAELTRPIVGTADLRTPPGRVEEAVREILLEIGEDPDRQGLRGTPDRVHRMYAELTAGYHVDPARLVNGAIFDVDYSERSEEHTSELQSLRHLVCRLLLEKKKKKKKKKARQK